MAKIVNLKRARKDRARKDKAATATENAVKHGRTRAERDADAAQKTRAEATLDAHKRDAPEP